MNKITKEDIRVRYKEYNRLYFGNQLKHCNPAVTETPEPAQTADTGETSVPYSPSANDVPGGINGGFAKLLRIALVAGGILLGVVVLAAVITLVVYLARKHK